MDNKNKKIEYSTDEILGKGILSGECDDCKIDAWNFFENRKDASGFVTRQPHFGNYKDWLKSCDEIGNENTVQFFVCEECMGIFVHEQPFRCERCGNWDEHKFKEITGEMRAEMEEGRTLDDIIKSYRYT